METTSLLPVLGLLALAVVVVILLLRFMRARHTAHDRLAEATEEAPAHAKLSTEEQEYLDSSHISGPIVPGGRDALETWQGNKRK